MAARLFHALKAESQSLRFVVQEATISLASAYKTAPLAVLQDLEMLLLKSSQVEESEVRFCAVRWATSLFDLQHCPSRFICMLGAADAKLDIRKMALEGLCLLKSESQSVSFMCPKLGMIQQMQHVCPECRGTGEVISERDRCPPCKGNKVTQEKKVLEVHVDKGM